MDIRAISNLHGTISNLNTTEKLKSNNDTFENIFNSIKNMVNETNYYTENAEQETLAYIMGLKNNSHDLLTAQQKASMSVQYTVSVRNHILDAYKEIMNLQF